VSNSRARLPAVACLIALSTAVVSGCAVPAGGPAYGGGLGVDYYEPYGYGYGGWGPGYYVAPFRGGDHRFDRGGGFSQSAHAFRSAPAGRGMPSLPAGGGRGGGGGHAGGGRRR